MWKCGICSFYILLEICKRIESIVHNQGARLSECTVLFTYWKFNYDNLCNEHSNIALFWEMYLGGVYKLYLICLFVNLLVSGGVCPEIRREVWSFLFGLYPCSSTTRYVVIYVWIVLVEFLFIHSYKVLVFIFICSFFLMLLCYAGKGKPSC